VISPAVRADAAGFTLIEMVVALALFAVIAAAGAGLVSTVLDAQRRTAGRLERLADIDRTLAAVTRDLTEITDTPLVGGPATIAFARHGMPLRVDIGYRQAGRAFQRVAAGQPQLAIDDVTAVRWHYLAAGGWQDRWPADPAQAVRWPAAVRLDLDLAGAPGGHVTRLIDLPVRPLPPGTAA